MRNRTAGYRYKSPATVLGMPLVCIATGPDLKNGEMRGHARGILAIGDIATGCLAIGGFARGIIAIGGLAMGVVTLGGSSLGLLLAVGGFSVGGIAFGGCAIGLLAFGGCAIGFISFGGAAFGPHAVSAQGQDPAVIQFLQTWFPGFFNPPRA